MADVELESLIRQAKEAALHDHPLARVAAARDLCGELNVLGDRVVDHFVLEARRAGCSWAQIGSVLGVTRQGAQQRYGMQRRMPLLTRGRGSPVTRFGPDARRAVVEAQAAARAMGHGSVDTAHLLLGILASGPDAVGAAVLESCGLERSAVDAEIAAASGRGETATTGHLPFAPGARKALELSLREALALGSRRIGSEHLALALLRDRSSLAARVLARHDIDHARVLAAVLERTQPRREG